MPNSQPTAIYAIAPGNHEKTCVRLSIERIAQHWTRVIAVCEDRYLDVFSDLLKDIEACEVRAFQDDVQTPLSAAKEVLLAERDALDGPVLLTGAHVLGPTGRRVAGSPFG